jgi:hypothetical protein
MTQAITSGRPAYELRSKQRGPSDLELEVWQVPSTATPELKEPRRVAGLGGHKLLLVEGAVLRRLKAEKVSLAKLKKGRGPPRSPLRGPGPGDGAAVQALGPDAQRDLDRELCPRHRCHGP